MFVYIRGQSAWGGSSSLITYASAGVAQLVEQLICNQQVAGSSPIASSMFGEVPERSKGPDCKSGGSAFEGSNPSLTTSFQRGVDERSII